MKDRAVHRWTLRIPEPYSRSDAAEFVRRARLNRRAASNLAFQIVRRTDGRLVGGLGLHRLDNPAGTAEVGYLLAREFRGQGYATEAVGGLVRLAFGPLGFHRLIAHVFVGNRPSERVLERSGFRREGRLREAVRKDGRWIDVILYARVRSDPAPARGRSSGGAARSPARAK